MASIKDDVIKKITDSGISSAEDFIAIVEATDKIEHLDFVLECVDACISAEEYTEGSQLEDKSATDGDVLKFRVLSDTLDASVKQALSHLANGTVAVGVGIVITAIGSITAIVYKLMSGKSAPTEARALIREADALSKTADKIKDSCEKGKIQASEAKSEIKDLEKQAKKLLKDAEKITKAANNENAKAKPVKESAVDLRLSIYESAANGEITAEERDTLLNFMDR